MIYDTDSEADMLRKEFKEALATGQTKNTKNGMPAIRGKYI